MLKPVGEQDVDTLFIEMERLTEWYIKADAHGEAVNAKWARTALNKFLPQGQLHKIWLCHYVRQRQSTPCTI